KKATARAAAKSVRLSELHIVDAPVRLYLPGLNTVVMVDRIGAALFAQGRDGRLHVAGLVDGARFQQRRLAVPAPRQREARQRLGEHRLLQLGALPIDAAIERHVDRLDLALAGPGQPADLVDAGAAERLFRA